ncbi:MAG TPA: hypothetical protein VEW95_09015, partial [Candidatus Limnocylindrales bacterium]|nr:hypothetical protein [Candidatus Limnocylindrales bacterium]
MKRLLAALGVAAIAAVTIVGPVASAQEGDALTRLQIRSIDTTDASAVAMVVDYTGEESDFESATIVENGNEIGLDDVAPIPSSRIATIIAVDTSSAMDGGGAL